MMSLQVTIQQILQKMNTNCLRMTISVTCNNFQILMNHCIEYIFCTHNLKCPAQTTVYALKLGFQIDHSRVALEIFPSAFSSHFARDQVAVYWQVKENFAHHSAFSLADQLALGFLIGLSYIHRSSSRCPAFQLFHYPSA